jgi:fructokinase
MIVVCGEALMDVFAECDTPTGVALDARIGGSPLNVAIGLARLGQRAHFLGALSRGFLGERIHRALDVEGVDLTYTKVLDAPTTLGLVGLDASGSASYAFYGDGCADRLLRAEHLPMLGEDVKALHFGSYTMVVEPVAATHRLLVEREHASRVIAYDPNLRLNVAPDLARWTETVAWMAERVHLLKVSSEDLELLRPGVPIRAVVDEWLRQGVSVVVVTLGAKGALGFTRSDSVRVDVHPVAVVDTVGAGDTFQAAMLTWLAEHGLLSIEALAALTAAPLKAALEFAGLAAAITCTRRGADMPRRDELPSRAHL